MRIVFIRHAEPDYSIDSLTEKGWREAGLLARRVSKWNVDRFYCSPLGRAQDTASCTLKMMGREAVTYPFLREFEGHVVNPATGTSYICWDLMPDYWTKNEMMYDRDKWPLDEIMLGSSNDINSEYKKVTEGLDGILKEYGYTRCGRYYVTDRAQGSEDVKACGPAGFSSESVFSGTDTLLADTRESMAKRADEKGKLRQIGDENSTGSEKTIVIFCHLGVTMVMMSYLLGVSAPVLWHGFFLAPTSVTILNTEERIDGTAYFRCQVMGDVTHLHMGAEPISNAGYFAESLQEDFHS